MKKTFCRLCGKNNLITFVDLGLHPPSDQFLTKEQSSNPSIFYPLAVNNCKNCGFKQLSHVVDPKIFASEVNI